MASCSRNRARLLNLLVVPFLISSLENALWHVGSAPSIWAAAAADTCAASVPVGDLSSETLGRVQLDTPLRVRGGESATAEASIESYLESVGRGKFHVNGWRWHTLSVIRDADRLEKLALHLVHTLHGEQFDQYERSSVLDTAAAHVIDFNLAGLFRIEDELFLPWLREKLCGEAVLGRDLGNGFRQVLDGIEEDRRHVVKIGKAIREQARIASSSNMERATDATLNVAQMSAALSSRLQDILDREERLIVPAIAAVVPEGEQRTFNNKVIRKLGVLDSRVHLVGMHDAVWEGPDVKERDAFEASIPYLARYMLPRWRKSLYEPQAGVLDYGK